MAAIQIPEDELRATVAAVRRYKAMGRRDYMEAAALELGIPHHAVRHRMRNANHAWHEQPALSMRREFDTLLIGHWHQYLPMPGCIVNGTLKGYCEYARVYLRARFQRPIQALWFTHPKHGPTFQVPVFCDETDAADVTRSWVEWAA